MARRRTISLVLGELAERGVLVDARLAGQAKCSFTQCVSLDLVGSTTQAHTPTVQEVIVEVVVIQIAFDIKILTPCSATGEGQGRSEFGSGASLFGAPEFANRRVQSTSADPPNNLFAGVEPCKLLPHDWIVTAACALGKVD